MDEKTGDITGAATQYETTSGSEKGQERGQTGLDNERVYRDVEQGAAWSVAETAKLLRKMDKALLPFLALLYLLSFLDRTNIGNARLAKLEQDLNMTGKWDYNVRILNDEAPLREEAVAACFYSTRMLTRYNVCRSPCRYFSRSTSQLRSRPTWP